MQWPKYCLQWLATIMWTFVQYHVNQYNNITTHTLFMKLFRTSLHFCDCVTDRTKTLQNCFLTLSKHVLWWYQHTMCPCGAAATQSIGTWLGDLRMAGSSPACTSWYGGGQGAGEVPVLHWGTAEVPLSKVPNPYVINIGLCVPVCVQ